MRSMIFNVGIFSCSSSSLSSVYRISYVVRSVWKCLKAGVNNWIVFYFIAFISSIHSKRLRTQTRDDVVNADFVRNDFPARFCRCCTCEAMPPTSVHNATLDSFARAEYWSQQQVPTERRSSSRFLYIDGLTYVCHVVLLGRFVVPPGIDRFASIHRFLCMWRSRSKRELFYALCRVSPVAVLCVVFVVLQLENYTWVREEANLEFSWKTAVIPIFVVTFRV